MASRQSDGPLVHLAQWKEATCGMSLCGKVVPNWGLWFWYTEWVTCDDCIGKWSLIQMAK